MGQYVDVRDAVKEFLETGEPELVEEFMGNEIQANLSGVKFQLRQVLAKNLKLAQELEKTKGELAKAVEERDRYLHERFQPCHHTRPYPAHGPCPECKFRPSPVEES